MKQEIDNKKIDKQKLLKLLKILDKKKNVFQKSFQLLEK